MSCSCSYEMAAQGCSRYIFAFEWRIGFSPLLKAIFFRLHFYRRQYGSNFNYCDVPLAYLRWGQHAVQRRGRNQSRPNAHKPWRIAPEFCEIMQNNSHCAVQGHSRSLFLYQLKPACDFGSYVLGLTYILSCTVCRISRIVGQIGQTRNSSRL